MLIKIYSLQKHHKIFKSHAGELSNIHFNFSHVTSIRWIIQAVSFYLPLQACQFKWQTSDMTNKERSKKKKKSLLWESCHPERWCESKAGQWGLLYVTIKDAFTLKINAMCQNYGHSDLTLDLIINRNSAGASASCQMQRREDFKVITCKSSGLMQSVWTFVWKWKHTRVCLDGVDDCAWCGAVSTPALPSVPLHTLWPLCFLAHNKCRTETLMNTSHSCPLEGKDKGFGFVGASELNWSTNNFKE